MPSGFCLREDEQKFLLILAETLKIAKIARKAASFQLLAASYRPLKRFQGSLRRSKGGELGKSRENALTWHERTDYRDLSTCSYSFTRSSCAQDDRIRGLCGPAEFGFSIMAILAIPAIMAILTGLPAAPLLLPASRSWCCHQECGQSASQRDQCPPSPGTWLS